MTTVPAIQTDLHEQLQRYAQHEQDSAQTAAVKQDVRRMITSVLDMLSKLYIGSNNLQTSSEFREAQRLANTVISVNSAMDPSHVASQLQLQVLQADNRALRAQVDGLVSKFQLQATQHAAELHEVKTKLQELTQEQLECRAHNISYEVVDLLESMISLDNGAINGRKQSLAQYCKEGNNEETLKEELNIRDMADFVGFVNEVKEGRRLHGHINMKELSYSPAQILRHIRETGISSQDYQYAENSLNVLIKRTNLNYADRPLLGAYIDLKKKLPRTGP